MGRGREVILEGGKRPREERPIEGVNNADSGERIHLELTSSEPRHRKMGNGMEDNSNREDRVVTDGEKPLKGGCPWTNRSETRSAGPRRVTSRERQTRSVGKTAARRGSRPRERGWEGVGGTRRRKVPAWTAQAGKGGTVLRRGRGCGDHARFRVGRPCGRAGWRRAPRKRSEDCGGQAPNATAKSMRGGCA